MESATIRVRGLSRGFGSEKVLKDVSISLEAGKILGLLGPSGSGKTTLIRCLAGILPPDEGKIDIGGLPAREVSKRIGYMAQSDALYEDLSGEQNVAYFAELYGLRGKELARRVSESLALVRLGGDRRKLVKHYSGGMKKRLSLAAALAHRPSILFLDEPTVGIDPVLRAEFWEEFHRLKDSGACLIVSTHQMDEACRCDLLAMIFEGRILAFGSPEEIMRERGTASIEDAFLSMRGDLQGTGGEK
jgi:ABC-2 type transport system ATP-binding protein